MNFIHTGCGWHWWKRMVPVTRNTNDRNTNIQPSMTTSTRFLFWQDLGFCIRITGTYFRVIIRELWVSLSFSGNSDSVDNIGTMSDRSTLSALWTVTLPFRSPWRCWSFCDIPLSVVFHLNCRIDSPWS